MLNKIEENESRRVVKENSNLHILYRLNQRETEKLNKSKSIISDRGKEISPIKNKTNADLKMTYFLSVNSNLNTSCTNMNNDESHDK